MEITPSFGNISYPTEINQRFFENRQLIADTYKDIGKLFLSYCISIEDLQNTEGNIKELIDLTKKLVNYLCTIDTSESLKLLFKLEDRKLVLDEEVILHLKKSTMKLKD